MRVPASVRVLVTVHAFAPVPVFVSVSVVVLVVPRVLVFARVLVRVSVLLLVFARVSVALQVLARRRRGHRLRARPCGRSDLAGVVSGSSLGRVLQRCDVLGVLIFAGVRVLVLVRVSVNILASGRGRLRVVGAPGWIFSAGFWLLGARHPANPWLINVAA